MRRSALSPRFDCALVVVVWILTWSDGGLFVNYNQ